MSAETSHDFPTKGQNSGSAFEEVKKLVLDSRLGIPKLDPTPVESGRPSRQLAPSSSSPRISLGLSPGKSRSDNPYYCSLLAILQLLLSEKSLPAPEQCYLGEGQSQIQVFGGGSGLCLVMPLGREEVCHQWKDLGAILGRARN